MKGGSSAVTMTAAVLRVRARAPRTLTPGAEKSTCGPRNARRCRRHQVIGETICQPGKTRTPRWRRVGGGRGGRQGVHEAGKVKAIM